MKNIVLILMFASINAFAQQTVTISGTGFVDVALHKNTQPGYESSVDTNYKNFPRISATAWTASGYDFFYRSLLKFDFSAIPASAHIQSATLYFYSDPTVTGSDAYNGNSQLSGSNAFYLERIVDNWDESTVTWNNQPNSSTHGRIWVGPSSSTTENIQIDLTSMVTDWHNNSGSNFGIKIKLENELKYRSRNYGSTDHSNSNIHPKLIITYNDSIDYSSTFSDDMNYIFQNVDRSPVQTGLLIDYGIRFTELEAFNGILNNNYASYSLFKTLYMSLYSMQFNSNAAFEDPAIIDTRINTVKSENPSKIIVPILDYEYERFKSDAVDNNLVYISNEQIFDVADRTESPYEKKNLFCATSRLSQVQGNTQIFNIPSKLLFTNTSKNVSYVQIDLGDSLGFRTINFDQDISTTYNSEGIKEIRVKIEYSDGSINESGFKIKVNFLICSNCRYDGNSIVVKEFEAPEKYDTDGLYGYIGRAKAKVTIETDDGSGTIDKPLIIVEDMDPWKELHPDDPTMNFEYKHFISGKGPGGININVSNSTLNQLLEDAGYDLIFIDFLDGTLYMENNAYVVEEVIKWVNDNKVGSEQNVVLGMGVGGVIARFALRDMEIKGEDPDTRLYISHDAPHQGANIPFSAQAAIHHWSAKGIIAGWPLVAIPIYPFGSVDKARELLERPVMRQLLKWQAAYDHQEKEIGISGKNLYYNFYDKLGKMGYPSLNGIRNIAIANGSECGGDIGFSAYSEFLNVTETRDMNYWFTLLQNLAIFTNHRDLALGNFLTTDSDIKITLRLNAMPDGEIKSIYHGSLIIKKTLLGFINYNNTLFTNSFTPFSSMTIPVDNANGGISNFTLFIDLNDYPELYHPSQKFFSFVSTHSALDISEKEPRDVVYSSELLKSYSPIIYNETPFSNIMVNKVKNEYHTQFTPENGQWLMDELENGGGFYSCMSSCAITPEFIIDGPSEFCEGSATYTITNAVNEVYYDWNKSNNLSYVSGGNGASQYTVSRNSSGDAFVEVRANDNCGLTAYRRLSPIIGTPPNINSPYVNQEPYYDLYPICPGYITLEVTPEGDSDGCVTWIFPPEVTSYYTSCTFAEFYLESYDPEGMYIITATASSSCGTTGFDFFLFYDSYDCGPSLSSTSVYPNPSSDEIIVETNNTGDEESEEINGVIIFDGAGNKIKEVNQRGNKVTVPVKGLKNGDYILHVQYLNKIIKHHIQIKR